MALRPGRCYRKPHRPFTRQSIKVPRKSYIKGVPRPKISEYEMGKKGKFSKSLFLISGGDVQIRHNSLEAARVSAVQTIEKNISRGGSYFLKIRVFPHNVIRENPLATGAGADRFQQGMRMSFGKPIGTAARVKKNQKLMEIRVNDPDVNAAKKALSQARYKLPGCCKVIVE
jgi:large subunit ribosomal protein L10e